LNNFEDFQRHFVKKCEAFIKMSRLFEDIFKEMGALIRNMLFEDLFHRIEAFLKTFKAILKNSRFFKIIINF
jgi:hypothetical protein